MRFNHPNVNPDQPNTEKMSETLRPGRVPTEAERELHEYFSSPEEMRRKASEALRRERFEDSAAGAAGHKVAAPVGRAPQPGGASAQGPQRANGHADSLNARPQAANKRPHPSSNRDLPLSSRMEDVLAAEPATNKSKLGLGLGLAALLLLLAAGGIFLLKSWKSDSTMQRAETTVAALTEAGAKTETSGSQSGTPAQAAALKLDLSFVKAENVQAIETENPLSKEGALSFMDPADNPFNPTPIPSRMGVLGYHKVRVDGALSAVCTDESLTYGFGFVETMIPLDENGQSSILGHRTLFQGYDMYDLDEAEVGDTFYVDDELRTKKRWVYKVVETKVIPVAELESYVFLGAEAGNFHEGPHAGNTMLLVTCNPKKYRSSEERILVYGQLTKTIPLEQLTELKKEGTPADIGQKVVAPGVLGD